MADAFHANPPEIRPRAVFERLFGSGEIERDPVVRARRAKYQASVLDSVLGDAKRLEATVGASDRRKLDEYMYAVRDIETRIQKTEQQQSADLAPAMDRPPASVPENYIEHTHLMFDLMTVAFQTDATRIVTFLMAIEQSNRAYREIGIADSHHGLTHHGGDKEKIEKCIMINRFQVEQFAWFIGKLKATKDGDGTLFDHVMVTYGSGLGKDHDHDNLPLVRGGPRQRLVHPRPSRAVPERNASRQPSCGDDEPAGRQRGSVRRQQRQARLSFGPLARAGSASFRLFCYTHFDGRTNQVGGSRLFIPLRT